MARIDDDHLITASLLRRFAGEARLAGVSDEYYALIERGNGELLSHHPFGPRAVPEQIMWAADVLKKLNRELHHDGAWVVVFTDPNPMAIPELAVMVGAGSREYARYALLWVDPDGDVQFAVEWVMNESELVDWCDVLMAGIDSVLNKCEAAWQMWKVAMVDVLDPAEGQTFKRAAGQRPTRH